VIYLFHNVYGDCDRLLDSLPEDVAAVPFGWGTDVERHRNDLLASLGCGVSGLPCLLVATEPGWMEFVFDPAQHDGWESLLAEAWAAASELDA
jgi:hypothetical protein